MSEVQKLKPTQPLGCLSRSRRRGVIPSETQSEGNVEKEFEGERLKIRTVCSLFQMKDTAVSKSANVSLKWE